MAKKDKDQPSLWQRVKVSLLWDLLRAQKRWAWLMVFMMVIALLFQLVLATLTKNMVDVGIVDQAVRLEGFVKSILITGVFLFAASFAQRQIGARVGYQIEFDLRSRLYRSIQSAELQRLDSMASGQLVTRALTDLNLIERLLQFAPTIAAFLPLLIGMSIFLAVVSPPMAILSLISMPVNLWLLRKFRDRLWGLSWAELNERAEVTAAIDEPVRGIRVVKAFGREDQERDRVAAVSLKAYRFGLTRWRLLAKYDVPLKFLPIVTQAVVLLIGAALVADGSLSLGTFLIAFQVVSAFTMFAGVVDEAASAWQYLRSAQSRIGEMLDLGSDGHDSGHPLPPPGDGLRLEAVSVTLGTRRVLTEVDLHTRPGELVVVTGAPGSGKTTLAAVAGGIMPVDAGRAILDGVDLHELEHGELRRAVRIVSEEPFLFAATVRENLELAAPHGASEEELRRALWAAAADDFVDDLVGGIDNEVGDRGLTLSGGQRQRVALARALVIPPRVIVLDDALSAVNPSLEVEILRRIRSVAPDTSVVCISRRKGATTVADRIVRLPDPDFTVAEPDGELPVASVVPADNPQLAKLAAVIADLKLTDEVPVRDGRVVRQDERPKVGTLLTTFAPVILVALVALVVQTLARLSPEVLFGSITDVVKDGGTGDAAVRSIALVFIGIGGTGGAYFFRVYSQKFNQGSMYVLRNRVFRRLSKLGVDYYDRELPGQVAARVVNDLDMLSTFLQSTGFQFMTAMATFLIGMVMIVIISPAVFPVVLVLAVIIGAVTWIQFPITTRAFDQARDQLGHVVSKFEEDCTARHEIRSFGAVQKQTDKFIAASLDLRRARRKATILANVFSELMQFLGQLTAVLVLYRTGNLVLAGTLSVGAALSVRLITTTATQPLALIGRSYGEYLNVRVSWLRLKEPFDVPILPAVKPNAHRCGPLAGEVVFDNVAFAYPHTGREVLHEVSFELPAGSVAALVGYTGAGKSSIAKLVTRTYDPDSGAVRVDGIDLRDLDLDTYRPRVGVVPQDAFVFRGTVGSNIAYGAPTASPADIVSAAEAVGGHQVLASLPGGYEHPVDEEGKNLTAAQRQLIALARAWIAKPALLILDEATSCLDAQLEQRVLDAVAALDCTTLMVTHRDNVVASSDHVIVLDAGRVVETGSPAELIGAGGAYDRLWVTVGPDQDDEGGDDLVEVSAGRTIDLTATEKPKPRAKPRPRPKVMAATGARTSRTANGNGNATARTSGTSNTNGTSKTGKTNRTSSVNGRATTTVVTTSKAKGKAVPKAKAGAAAATRAAAATAPVGEPAP